MNPAACSLDTDELVEQLERYRALGRSAAAVECEASRVVVRFADDPPNALIERTLEVERGCCPFFEIDYEPDTRRLAIMVDRPDRRPSLDAIAAALTETHGADLLPDDAPGEIRIVPGVTSCCSPGALETCCDPQDKPECCGQPSSGASTVAAPSRCGCDA
jgi:hypothetical protein